MTFPKHTLICPDPSSDETSNGWKKHTLKWKRLYCHLPAKAFKILPNHEKRGESPPSNTIWNNAAIHLDCKKRGGGQEEGWLSWSHSSPLACVAPWRWQSSIRWNDTRLRWKGQLPGPLNNTPLTPSLQPPGARDPRKEVEYDKNPERDSW